MPEPLRIPNLEASSTTYSSFTEKCQYQTLPAHQGWTRVISLQPAENPQAKLVCYFEIVQYSDPEPKFEAISYTWGFPWFPEVLLCHQGTVSGHLRITENLADALRQFRYRDEERRLWVDAVCINQDDEQEKSSQVAQMGGIYAAAEAVIVWLGLENSDTKYTFEFCHTISELAPACGLDPSSTYEPDKTNWNSAATSEQRSGILRGQHYEETIQMVKDLINRPWFTRRWVIQEVFHGGKIMVHCGKFEIDWEVMAVAIITAYTLREHARRISAWKEPYWCENDENKRWFQAFSLARTGLGGFSPTPIEDPTHSFLKKNILNVLYNNDYAECSDPRDILYSHISMSRDTEFQADYSLSTLEAFTSFACSQILDKNRSHEGTSPYDILHHRRYGRSFRSCSSPIPDDMRLPSWVPNWRNRYSIFMLGGIQRLGFQAGKQENAVFAISDNKQQLRVRGYGIGAMHVESWRIISDLDTEAMKEQDWTLMLIRRMANFKHVYEEYDFSVLGQLPPIEPLALTLVGENILSFTSKMIGEGASPESIRSMFSDLLYHNERGENRSKWTAAACKYFDAVDKVLYRTRFFLIGDGQKNRIGIGPHDMEEGDVFAVFHGAATPFVLRPTKVPDSDTQVAYRLVGECYVYGLMNGEAFGLGLSAKDFLLV